MSGGLRDELKSKASQVAYILLILSVILGCVVSYYFYRKSILSGRIVYEIEQVQVFDQRSLNGAFSNVGSPLFLVNEKGDKVTNNVYAATLKIWNAGNDEIRIEDVRTPFSINIDGGTLINAKIAQQTRDAEAFKLSPDLLLGWQHFDSNEGCKINLIYSADEQKTVAITGYAVKSQNFGTVREAKRNTRTLENKRLLLGLILTILLIPGWLLIGSLIRQPAVQRWMKWIFFSAVTFNAVMNMFFILNIFEYVGSALGMLDIPPF